MAAAILSSMLSPVLVTAAIMTPITASITAAVLGLCIAVILGLGVGIALLIAFGTMPRFRTRVPFVLRLRMIAIATTVAFARIDINTGGSQSQQGEREGERLDLHAEPRGRR